MHISARHDRGFLYRGMLDQRRLYLPGVDPKPSDFDLVIATTEKIDFAPSHVTHHVACPKQTRSGLAAERIGDESLGG
jgi:hypothetical protein